MGDIVAVRGELYHVGCVDGGSSRPLVPEVSLDAKCASCGELFHEDVDPRELTDQDEEEETETDDVNGVGDEDEFGNTKSG